MSQHELQILTDAQVRLRGDLEALTALVAEHGGALDGLEQVLATTPSAAGEGGDINGYTAKASSGKDHEQAVKAVTEWLEWANPTLIVPRSPKRLAVPGCWNRHPPVVEELLALHAAWLAAYAEGPSDAMIAWHDRWLDSSVTRVFTTYTLDNCARDGQCQLDRQPPQGNSPADVDDRADVLAGTGVQR